MRYGMENKMNRMICATIERCSENPNVSIHDQNAGSNNVLKKEMPNRAELAIRNLVVGDPTMWVCFRKMLIRCAGGGLSSTSSG